MKKDLQKLIEKIKTAEKNLAELKNELYVFNESEIANEKEVFDCLYPESVEEYKVRLEENEELLQKTEEFSKVGRWSFSFEDSKLVWSKETYKIFDYPEGYEGTLDEYYISCLDKRTYLRLPRQFKKLRVKRSNSVMNHLIHTPKNTKLLSFSAFPVFNESNEVIGAEGFVKDISEKITGKSGLDSFFKMSSDLHCIVHSDKYFVKVSPAWVDLLGYSEEELLSKSYLEFVHPDDLYGLKKEIKEFGKNRDGFSFENRYIKKSGEVVYLGWFAQLDSETDLAYCTARDLTKSTIARDELLSDLSSKDLLLREIHHRVKNNLQIISSLLSLQAGANSEEENLAELYQESKNRIQSMAAIHEMFYQSEELDKIEFGKYLDKLIKDLAISFESQKKKIDFTKDADLVYVNLDTAVPLGLLINEIITNSMKHGEDENGNVKISIRMKIIKKGQLEIIIGDNGVNSLDDILNQSVDSLGILLINSLVEQIDGEIEQLTESKGTVYKLHFGNSLYNKGQKLKHK